MLGPRAGVTATLTSQEEGGQYRPIMNEGRRNGVEVLQLKKKENGEQAALKEREKRKKK